MKIDHEETKNTKKKLEKHQREFISSWSIFRRSHNVALRRLERMT